MINNLYSIRKIIIVCLLFLIFSNLCSQTKKEIFFQDISPTLIDNPILLLGINEEKNIISYVNSFISIGRGDIRYNFIIYDYGKNLEIENLYQTWMAKSYDEYGITDWDNIKYSVKAYLDMYKEEITLINKKYSLAPIVINEVAFNNFEVYLIEREKLVGWFEKISYSIDFIVNTTLYQYENTLSKVDYIKTVDIDRLYEVKNYFICIQKISHDTFEDDDYYDYIIRGIKKKQ